MADIDIVCGRYGACCGRYGLWPMSFVADMVVADMVCGRYRRFPFVVAASYSQMDSILLVLALSYLLPCKMQGPVCYIALAMA